MKILDDLYINSKMKSNSYVPDNEFSSEMTGSVKPIAFYLPQFYPISENDINWGKGFTEWTNVTKAVPQFPGHYQPHLPDELGFYDLRLIDTQKRQIEIAKNYGIYGFCYHYYWFDGKKVLDLPLNRLLNHFELDFPFCICWANENWTRKWDGLENEIIFRQNHNEESDIRFIQDIAPILRDPRYIKIRGYPVLILYRPQLLADPKKTASVWRTYCREHGIGEIYLLAVQGFGFKDPREIGFDAVLEFPPLTIYNRKVITKNVHISHPEFTGNVYDYEAFVQSKQYLDSPPYTQYKTVCPGWDNTARRPTNPSIFHRATPEIYQEWLENIIEFTQKERGPDEQFIFINAWNEWAEGAHLEPDRKFGFGYLQATRNALIKSKY